MALLYDRYSAALYGIICRIVPCTEIAEEALQDVFLKVWENADRYDSGKGRLFTWLAQITRNTALDKLRTSSYLKSRDTYSIEMAAGQVLPHLAETFTTQDSGLLKVLDGLDSKHRVLIDCIYFKGYTQIEVSEAFSMPLGTVKTRVRAAMNELRRVLKHDIAITA